MSILVLAAVILAIVFWARPSKHNVNQKITEEVIQAANLPSASTSAVTPSGPVGPVPPQPVAGQTPKTAATNNTELQGVIKQFVNSQNTPFYFYGRIIDQYSNALPGVDIKVCIEHLTEPGPVMEEFVGAKEIHLAVASDADGRFEIHGETGESIDLESMKKSGYEAEPGQRTYGPTSGSSAQPVLFKMWSANSHEHLIGGKKTYDIVPDGRPYVLNLTGGTVAESGDGDLRAWVKYVENRVRGQTYDWSCEIDALHGGLLEEPLGMAMYMAPSNGYTPSFQFHQQIKGGQRGSTGARRFYLLLNNGQEYGKMEVELYAPFNMDTPGMIRLSYSINPSGSQILY